MKKIILPIIIVLVLGALFSIDYYAPVFQGRKAYKEFFRKSLKDPESLKIYSEKYEKESGSTYTIHWTLDIGARNSYGGMVRETYHIQTIGDRRTIWVKIGEYGRKESIELDEL